MILSVVEKLRLHYVDVVFPGRVKVDHRRIFLFRYTILHTLTLSGCWYTSTT